MIDCGHTCGVFQDTTADMAFLSATFVIEDGQEIDGACVSINEYRKKNTSWELLEFLWFVWPGPCTLTKLMN